MPINKPYKGYDEEIEKVTRVRDFADGEDAVKAKADLYLPKLGGQSKGDYNSYLMRGYLVPAIQPTITAICGSIMRMPPVFEVSEDHYINNDIDGDGSNVNQLVSGMVEELLYAGGVGYLIDYQDNAIVKQYTKENIIHYTSEYIVLAQTYSELDDKDKFVEHIKTEYLELAFDDGGYIQNVWRETKQGWVIVDTLTPTNRGERLVYLPFVYATPGKLGFRQSDPLLLHMANINHKQYMQSTDESHGLHWTALPTLFLFGDLRNDDGKKVRVTVGAGSSNHIDDTDCRAELLEFTGKGIESLKASIDDKIATMATIGAKMLMNDSGGVKAAETARIEASSETATLSVLANTVDLAMEAILDIISEWSGEVLPEFTVNRDFIDTKLEPQALLAYLQTMLSGGMSKDSFLNLLVKGELLPKGITAEDEADRIETTGGDFVELEDEEN